MARRSDGVCDERIKGNAGDVEGGCAVLHRTTQPDGSVKCI